jgi:tRNA (mo5U34)-methyltransferase
VSPCYLSLKESWAQLLITKAPAADCDLCLPREAHGGQGKAVKAVEELAERVKTIDWYHTIDLPGGVTTHGVNNSAFALARLDLPTSLAGKSVLDVGAWDGFYSFEAAKRGAARVLATDSFVWQGRWKQTGFLLARQALGLEDAVEDRLIDVMDLSPEALGETFDVVLFLGVLYHLPDPVTALRRVSSVCNELLLIETETALNFLPFPAARLWPGRELKGDDTNWWSLNKAALVELLKTFGFREVRVVYRTPLLRRLGRAVKSRTGFWAAFRGSRIVIQARR